MTKKKNTKKTISKEELIVEAFNSDGDEVSTKSLENTTVSRVSRVSRVSDARKNVPDIEIYGNGDTFKLICKASSNSEGWMKSTKALHVVGVGCLVQVTTQQRNKDGSYSVAEALSFMPGVKILEINNDEKQGRVLIKG